MKPDYRVGSSLKVDLSGPKGTKRDIVSDVVKEPDITTHCESAPARLGYPARNDMKRHETT